MLHLEVSTCRTHAVPCPRQVPRFMTKTCLLDYDSIAGADKFGNIFVLRVPADVSDDVDNPTGVIFSVISPSNSISLVDIFCPFLS